MVTKDLVAASSKPLVLSILAEGESYGYEITVTKSSRRCGLVSVLTIDTFGDLNGTGPHISTHFSGTIGGVVHFMGASSLRKNMRVTYETEISKCLNWSPKLTGVMIVRPLEVTKSV